MNYRPRHRDLRSLLPWSFLTAVWVPFQLKRKDDGDIGRRLNITALWRDKLNCDRIQTTDWKFWCLNKGRRLNSYLLCHEAWLSRLLGKTGSHVECMILILSFPPSSSPLHSPPLPSTPLSSLLIDAHHVGYGNLVREGEDKMRK